MRKKVFLGILLLFFVLMVAVLGLVWGTLSASLPTLDGKLEVAGLERPVEVERDPLGIVRFTRARGAGQDNAGCSYF